MTERIDWEVIRQAYALLGYKFTPPPTDMQALPDQIQVMAWQCFLHDYMRCKLECAWKGGRPCRTDDCPRSMLQQVSVALLPLTGVDDASLADVARILHETRRS